LIRCQVVQGSIPPDFVEIAANAGHSRIAIERRLRTTAGQVGVSGTDIKNTPLPIPPLKEQLVIVERVQQKLSQIEAMDGEVDRALIRGSRLRQATLKTAFGGKLVPQDPKDEPATALLERIKLERLQASAERNGLPKKFATKRRIRKVAATAAVKNSRRKANRSGKSRKTSANRIVKRKS
jgi:type I restriction enzyme S subunit